MQYHRSVGRFVSILLVGAGCGSGDFSHSAPDGGEEEDAGLAPTAPEAPGAPEPPRAGPCPSGWREVADADDARIVFCEPWPESGHSDCAIDEAHFPGGAGCQRIGTPCAPGDDWAADAPAGAIFVRAGASAGGTGTRAAPFATIGEALALAGSGDVVAVGKGTYDERVSVARGVTILGACVAETLLSPSSVLGAPAVRIRFGGGAIRNLRIEGAGEGVWVEGSPDAPATVESTVVSATDRGVWVGTNGLLTMTDVAVRSTAGTPGHGVETSGRVEMERVAFSENREAGIVVAGTSASLVASDVVVTGTRASSSSRVGYALDVEDGAAATCDRCVLESSVMFAAHVGGAGGRLDATDLVVRRVESPRGVGLVVNEGASLTLARTRVEDVREAAILAGDEGSTLAAEDLVVRDVIPKDATGIGGYGMRLQMPISVTLSRVAIVRATSIGVSSLGGPTLDASDLLVLSTREGVPSPDFEPTGVGLWSIDASATVSRARVEGSVGAGVVCSGGTASFADLAVLGTAASGDGAHGSGVQVIGGAQVDLRRAEVSDSRSVGIVVSDAGTVLSGGDVLVEDTLSRPSDGHLGDGFEILEGAEVDLAAVAISRSHRMGVDVAHSGTRASFEDLVIEETMPTECSGAVDCGFGDALGAAEGAAVSATRFVLSDGARCGIVVWPGSSVDLHHGVVARNAIGANVEEPDYDLGRLQDDVRFVDNVVRLDADALPLPSDAEL